MNLRISLGTGLLLLACAGSSTKPATTQLNVDNSPAANAVAEPDLSPVTAPTDLIAVARVSQPKRFVETLAGWAGIPLSLLDALPSEATALSEVIDWNAPIEGAAVLNRHSTRKSAEPEGVFSIGITTLAKALDLAREHGVKPTEVSPAVYRLDFEEKLSCALAPALGASRLRLVCGNGWAAVEDLLPYATRGLPTQALANQDLYVSLNAAPLQARYAEEIGSIRLLTGLLLRQIQSDDARFDRALTDVAYAIADEAKALALDAQRVELTSRLDTAQNQLNLAYAVQFGGEQSFLVQLTKEMGARAKPAPDAWFELPKTADSAGFSVGMDGKRLQPLFTSAAELADAGLQRHKAAQPLRRHVRALLEGIPELMVSTISASGENPSAVGDTLAARVDRALGWEVSMLDVRADRVTAFMNELAAVISDREVNRVVKAQFQVELKGTPKMRNKVIKVAGFDARCTAYTLELPNTWVEAWLEESGEPKAKPGKPVTLSVIVAPDGDRTWVVYGSDEASVKARLESIRAGREGRLSEVPELAGLRGTPLVAGAFINLKRLLSQLDEKLPGNRKTASLLARAPNAGKSPWLVRMQVTPMANGSGTETRGSLEIPKKAFEDAGALIPSLMNNGGAAAAQSD